MGFIILLWLIFSIYVGVGAKARGRSGPGWFLLAILFSPPLAVLALFLLADKSASAAESAAPQDDQIECLKCGELIARNAKICPLCGFEVLPDSGKKAQGHASVSTTSDQG